MSNEMGFRVVYDQGRVFITQMITYVYKLERMSLPWGEYKLYIIYGLS